MRLCLAKNSVEMARITRYPGDVNNTRTCCAALLPEPRTPSGDGGRLPYACAACSAVNCDPQHAAGPLPDPGGAKLPTNGEKRSRNRGPPPSWGRRPRDDYRRRSPPPRRRSPRRRSFSRSRSRSLSRDRRRERSLSRERNHKPSRSFSRSRSRSRSNERK